MSNQTVSIDVQIIKAGEVGKNGEFGDIGVINCFRDGKQVGAETTFRLVKEQHAFLRTKHGFRKITVQGTFAKNVESKLVKLGLLYSKTDQPQAPPPKKQKIEKAVKRRNADESSSFFYHFGFNVGSLGDRK